jgi:indole-3-glycerol phosphate synthase
MKILEKIIQAKQASLAKLEEQVPVKQLEKRKLYQHTTLSLAKAILDPTKTGIIAEFKRKSPSRGVINEVSTIEEVTTGYFRSGASAISVLTDQHFFGGTTADLIRTRELNPIPILRKDFIISEYQVVESKAIGADAILLIAAALDKDSTLLLARLARSLWLEVLLEVHNESELDHVNQYVNIIGVNNRDLDTFAVDPAISMTLADKIPAGFVRISESGIASPLTIKWLKEAGYQGFLIGENFMRTPDPALAFADFIKLII